ncbi:hypothetical protein QJS66_01645 [Kocuria rhizophila]|nr:hypothetical protein QJS66_01645 [Kocuria rhizophila]
MVRTVTGSAGRGTAARGLLLVLLPAPPALPQPPIYRAVSSWFVSVTAIKDRHAGS